jgi:ferredoxin
VAVSDVVRAHAYANRYGDRELAASVFASLGYDPRSRCTKCGTCAGICPAGIDLPRAVHEAASMLA